MDVIPAQEKEAMRAALTGPLATSPDDHDPRGEEPDSMVLLLRPPTARALAIGAGR